MILHPCDYPHCTEWGAYGYGSLRKFDKMIWRCREHRLDTWDGRGKQ